jgi:hypothetical protein
LPCIRRTRKSFQLAAERSLTIHLFSMKRQATNPHYYLSGAD